MSEQHHNPANQDKKPTLIQTISSILAALFGVQSAKNRERDRSRAQQMRDQVSGPIRPLPLIPHLALRYPIWYEVVEITKGNSEARRYIT